MLKKIGKLILTISMCLALLWAVPTETNAAGTHSSHTDGTWTPLSTDSTALSSGNYYLENNITRTSTLYVSGEVTICLNGKTLKQSTSAHCFCVQGDGNLTICDCGGSGKITNTKTGISGQSCIGLYDNSSMTVYGGTIYGAQFNAISCITTGDLQIHGGTITGVSNSIDIHEINDLTVSSGTITATSGSAIAVEGTFRNITVSGGTIEGIDGGIEFGAFTCTGRVLISGGTLYGKGPVPSGTTYQGHYYGLTFMNASASSCDVNISGGTIHGARGGVYNCNSLVNITVSGGSLGDSVYSQRNGIYATAGTIQIDGGKIYGMYCYGQVNVTMTNGEVLKITSYGDSSKLYPLKIYGGIVGRIDSKTADKGILCSGALEIYQGTIIGTEYAVHNSSGGSVMISDGTVTGETSDIYISNAFEEPSDALLSMAGYSGNTVSVSVNSASVGSYVAKDVAQDGLVMLTNDGYFAFYDTKNSAVKISDSHMHSWDEGTQTTPPTIESEGILTYTCILCGSTKTETTPKLEATITNGYSTGISTLTTSPSKGESVTINISVSHESDTSFNAGELVVTYDPAKLTFNKNASSLGTATVSDSSGTLKIEDYGADKATGNAVYSLTFDTIGTGSANVTLTSAAFIHKENAAASDLIPATISPATVSLSIQPRTFSVSLPNGFSGAETVQEGGSYTFSITDKNHTYSNIAATVNNAAVTVTHNDNGTYTVSNVMGALTITATATPKTYSVTFSGNAAADIVGAADTATYGTNYTFTIPSADGWSYKLESVSIGGTGYSGYTSSGATYTIPGTAITGEILITVTKEETQFDITVDGASGDVSYDGSVQKGEDVTITLIPEAGYSYIVTATMNGKEVEVIDNGDGTYTVKNVTGDLIFSVEKVVIADGVAVTNYLTIDGSNIWLVKNATTVAANKVPSYDGKAMFWSEEYQAYCYLVLADSLDADTAKKCIGIMDGTAVTVDYGMDVNKTEKVDASDAQLVYNIYNAQYSEFTADVTMEKLLRADVNKTGTVTVEDAAAIINAILTSA